jgi:hypothetical protein
MRAGVAAPPEKDSSRQDARSSSSSSNGGSSSSSNGHSSSRSSNGHSSSRSSGDGSKSKWRSLLTSSIDEVAPFGLPTVAELPAQLSQLLDSSDDGDMMSHLHSRAAEAAAATQVLHALQQQEAEAAVKSAELAASSLAAERKLAAAVKSEATAAGRLLQAEHAATTGDRAVSTSWGSRVDVATKQQLEAARQQLEESVAARAAAQAELQELKAALTKEQKQVRGAAVAVPTDSTLRCTHCILSPAELRNSCVTPAQEQLCDTSCQQESSGTAV